MTGKRSRHHHIVPKALQKSFCFEGKTLWYCERGADGKFSKPAVRNIGSAFVIFDYNTVLVGGKPSDIVESQFYGKIDNYLGQLLPSLVAGFKERRVPTFSGKSLTSLQRVIFEMVKRTPDFTKKNDDIKTGREIVEAELSALDEGDHREGDRVRVVADLNNDVVLRQLGRHARVSATISQMPLVNDALKEFSVRWATIEGKESFILSSLMAYRIGNGGNNGLSNPDMEIWMPISPKVSLVLVRDPLNKIPLRVPEVRDHVRAVNEFAVANSNFIASHSDTLLKSLISRSPASP